MVDRDLATERAVDHRQQRGRQVHVGHAAHVHGGDPAAEVGDHAAAEAEDHVAPAQRALSEPMPELDGRVQGLAGLARGDRVREHLQAVSA
jgi:hypothetical protein